MTEISGLHPQARATAELLILKGVEGPFREFSATTKTARDAASALGCEVGAIASTLVFHSNEGAFVVIKSGASPVNLRRLESTLGLSGVRMATATEVSLATGQVVGGVSPIGWPAPLPTYIDCDLAKYDVIWAACGTSNAVFATEFVELTVLANANGIDLHKD